MRQRISKLLRRVVRLEVILAAIVGAVFSSVGMTIAENSAHSQRNAANIEQLRAQVCEIIKASAAPSDLFYQQNCKKM